MPQGKAAQTPESTTASLAAPAATSQPESQGPPDFQEGLGKGPRGAKGTTSLNGTHMDVSKNSGTPKWMVYNGKPY